MIGGNFPPIASMYKLSNTGSKIYLYNYHPEFLLLFCLFYFSMTMIVIVIVLNVKTLQPSTELLHHWTPYMGNVVLSSVLSL